MSVWDRAIAFVLAAEGGYVADDAGKGPSNFGINATAHPGLDIKNLTKDQAIAVYKRDYWDAIGGDRLDPPLAIAAMDTAVNMGTGRAQRYLQMTSQWRELLAQRAHDYVTFKNFPTYGREWLTRVFALYTICLKEEQS